MQLITVRIDDGGSFATGFSVSFQIREHYQPYSSTDLRGDLPPNLDLHGQYLIWQAQYCRLLTYSLGSDPFSNSGQASIYRFQTNSSTRADEQTCRECAKKLERTMADWLRSPGIQQVREAAIAALANHQGKAQWIIQLPVPNAQAQSHHEQSVLWRLPWHVWDIFQDYPSIEPTLVPLEFLSPPQAVTERTQVRILAVSGDDDRIDLEESIREFAQLQNIELNHLPKPSAEAFICTLNDEQGWDVLFFTGHSGTRNLEGWFEINRSTKLDVDGFKYALRQACRRGLKLAIFSSCNGGDLAKNLASFNVPTIIAMREIIPDRVAKQFIREFLKAFTNDQKPVDMPMAVRQARESLEELADYPGVTWLPMIFQRSPQILPTWRELCVSGSLQPGQELSTNSQLPTSTDIHTSVEQYQQSSPSFRQQFQPRQIIKVALISLVIVGLTISIREMGWLQSLELLAFDQLVRLRPEEKPDPRIVVVTVDNDIEGEKTSPHQVYSISDRTLNILLSKINNYNPFSIGLDIYRNQPTNQNEDFQALIQTMSGISIVSVCQSPSNVNLSTPPPPRQEESVAFSDLVKDYQDGVVRRSLLSLESVPGSKCPAQRALSVALADDYLSSSNRYLAASWMPDVLKIGNSNFYSIQNGTAAYRRLDSQGFQVLLNYRAGQAPFIFNTVAANNILAGEFDHSLLNNRVVIIGTIGNAAKRLKDIHKTPYGDMPGVFIHAHMTSQILSAVLDQRPLLWSLPPWGDRVVVLILGITSLPLVLKINRFSQFFQILLSTVGGIVLLAFVALWQFGVWLPLLPSVISFIASSVAIWSIHKKS